MSYSSNDSPTPNFQKVLETGDPRWATRPRPRKGQPNDHNHVPGFNPADAKKELSTKHNGVHGSLDTYYKIKTPVPCNVAVRPCNDPTLVWEYDDHSTRQSARAYISRPAEPETTHIVKVARRKGKQDTVTAVHPAVWQAMEKRRPEPPGDVVGLLNRHVFNGDDDAKEKLVARLRANAPICVYFL